MPLYYSLALVVFLAVLAILLIRYVNATVDHEFRKLARASSDGEYRKDELASVDGLLAGQLPLPADVPPLSGPLSGGRGAVPPILMGLGVILLWGAGSAPKEKELWFAGSMVSLALSCVIMLVTLRRRKWERTARLLRFRADLKRMDDDRSGAAGDLRQLLRLTPWDDAAWAELSEDVASGGDLEEALDAMGQAARLDPKYDEYRMLEASYAIRLGKLGQARTAIKAWKEVGDVRPDDPRPVAYQAAIELAEGRRDEAAETLKSILLDYPDASGYELLDTDQALNSIKDLLPGGGRSENEDGD